MLGTRSLQGDIFDVGNVYALRLPERSFYCQLANAAPKLFSDTEFSSLYSSTRGRPSVPPSLLALMLLLQWYSDGSDMEAVERSGYDLRWCAVLGRPAGEPLCAKSTLQLFRSQLILHEQFSTLFKRSFHVARRHGMLRTNEIKTALDTKPILGRGAVEDTYNLLGTAMQQLARAVARANEMKVADFLSQHNLERLGAPSIKGTVDIDWSNEKARQTVLTDLVMDARRLMALADGAVPDVKQSAELLEQLLLQDIEVDDPESGSPSASIKQGTVKGRIPSATDPEQRHGRKSASKRFVGSKASISADIETGLILSTDVLSGCKVTEVIADCAYGSGETRKEFANAGVNLVAKVPGLPSGPLFAKTEFLIELPTEAGPLENAKVTCPAGAVAGDLTPQKGGGVTFHFDNHCREGCPLRTQCTTSYRGRSLHLHPEERLIQQARVLQASVEGRQKLRQRLVVENALGRLAGYGISQARYIGRPKTMFQLAMSATVANLRLIWNWAADPSRAPLPVGA